jgi:hypothetical protein
MDKRSHIDYRRRPSRRLVRPFFGNPKTRATPMSNVRRSSLPLRAELKTPGKGTNCAKPQGRVLRTCTDKRLKCARCRNKRAQIQLFCSFKDGGRPANADILSTTAAKNWAIVLDGLGPLSSEQNAAPCPATTSAQAHENRSCKIRRSQRGFVSA